MMPDLSQWLLVLTAIAIGWAIGRRGRAPADERAPGNESSAGYYQGLNFLLNDEPDAAIDSFVNSLEVNSDTLETHLAVGTLLRRRGEVDRAIRIHQNLLARPSLPARHLHQVHLELARDYISAGLLDRAERMLQDLLGQSPEYRTTALRHLLEIYQDEREWGQAIAVARELLPKKPWLRSTVITDDGVSRSVAHFYCETAELALAERDFQLARSALRHAINHDSQCVRASMLLGRVELEADHPKMALKALRRIAQQNPVYLPEVVELLREAYRRLDAPGDYAGYLLSCYEQHPSTAILLALVDAIRDSNGEEQAASFFTEQLKKRPTLRGLSRLIEFQSGRISERARENLGVLQALVAQLLTQKPSYQCHHCGFSGRKLHWLCPSCKQWGTIAPIRGAEGD